MTGPNHGIAVSGSGSVTIERSAVGQYATVHNSSSADRTAEHADIGIITVLAEETAAVLAFLTELADYRSVPADNGVVVHQATVPAPRRPLKTVLVQTTRPGEVAAATMTGTLRNRYNPRFVAVVGIAGGIHPAVRRGDVVVADAVIRYDQRKETDAGVVRRGQIYSVSTPVQQATNAFFADAGSDSFTMNGFSVRRGPVGSGDAVVATAMSGIRAYLLTVNDKTLAVEMEAGGVAHEFAERPGDGGWLSVRGISDLADNTKTDDAYRVTASANAASVLWKLMAIL